MRTRTVGWLAREAGVSVQTIRYYHRLRILSRPNPVEGKWRIYGEESVFAVRLIKRLQEMGFTLAEIRDLLPSLHDPRELCRKFGTASQRKLIDLERKVRELNKIRSILADTVHSCQANPNLDACQVWVKLETELNAPRRAIQDEVFNSRSHRSDTR